MTTALWLDEAHAPAPPLGMDVEADVAIVGAGMTGTTLALFLAERGIHVIVLDQGVVAGGASGRSAGFVITGLGEHYVNSRRTYGVEGARTIWRVNHDNVDLVRDLVERHRIDCGYRRRGSVTLALTEDEERELVESAELATRDGFPCSLIDAATVNKRLASEGFRGGLLQERDGEVHPARFVRGLARSARAAGARIHETTPVTGIAVREGGVRVATPGGTVQADDVVIAANAWGPSLHPYLHDVTRPVRAQVLATDILHHPGFDVPVYCDHGYEYWRGHGGRAILGGMRLADREAESTIEDDVNPGIQERLEGFLRRHFPGVAYRVTHRWSGPMCFSADGLPIIGTLPGEERVHAAVGFMGHGFGYAQVAARWLAEKIGDGKDNVPPLFRPGRVFEPSRAPV